MSGNNKVEKELDEDEIHEALSINLSEQKSTEFRGIVLVSAFHQSIRRTTETGHDIGVKEYVLAYNEVIKFLEKLGAIFYFVVSDIREKVNILDSFLEQNPENYETISRLVAYETEQRHLVKGKEKPNNGARTILRLHRALIFVYELVQNLYKAESTAYASEICVTAYDRTLAQYHSWIVRKAARFGMKAMPNRDTIIALMSTDPDEIEKFPVFFAKVLDVYNITQDIYETNKILELP